MKAQKKHPNKKQMCANFVPTVSVGTSALNKTDIYLFQYPSSFDISILLLHAFFEIK